MKTKHMAYLTRNLRCDLHERLRFVAALQQRQLEEVVNDALEVGLTILERQLAQEGVEQLHAIAEVEVEAS